MKFPAMSSTFLLITAVYTSPGASGFKGVNLTVLVPVSYATLPVTEPAALVSVKLPDPVTLIMFIASVKVAVATNGSICTSAAPLIGNVEVTVGKETSRGGASVVIQT